MSRFFSSISNNSTSSSPCGNPMNGGFFSPQPKKKKQLTRQRKFRRVSAEFHVPEDDDGDISKSKSLPDSPDFDLKSPRRSPQHWSFSAVPQPLPLPNEELRFPAEVLNSR